MTMRLLTLSLAGAEILMQREFTAYGRLPEWGDRAALEEGAQTLRKIIWDQRSRTPDPRDFNDEVQSPYCAQPALISCAIADCLFAWQKVVEYAQR